MPSELSDLLEAADVPPMSIDPGAVLVGGKRRRRHRRLAEAVGALGIGVVVALGAAAAGWHPGAAQVVPAAQTSADSASPSPVTPVLPVAARVTLDVGHCWIEYVEFDGRLWGLPFANQIGSGGGLPGSWKGTGSMTRISTDRSRYTDDGGAVLEMVPARGASVYEDERRPCM